MSQLNQTYEGDENMKITIALQKAKIDSLQVENSALLGKIVKLKKSIGALKKKSANFREGKNNEEQPLLSDSSMFAPTCKIQ